MSLLPKAKISKRIVCEGQENVAFPRMKRVRLNPEKDKMPEKTIQSITDMFLSLNHLTNMRLPDNMFRAIMSHSGISSKMKSWILFELGGWSDNTAYKHLCEFNGVKVGLYCMIENKTESGELRGKQKLKDKELGFNICRGEDDIKKIIKEFNAAYELLKRLLDGYRAADGPEITESLYEGRTA